MWTVVFWLILANSLSNPPKFLISKTGELSNQKKLLFFAHPQWILQRVGVFFVEFSDKKMNGRTSSLRRRIVVLAKFDQEEGGGAAY